MSANQQMLMGGGGYYFPAGAELVYDASVPWSIRATGDVPADFHDTVTRIIDLSGKGRHAVQGVVPGPHYLKADTVGYLYCRASSVSYPSSAAYLSRMNMAAGMTIEACVRPLSWGTGTQKIVSREASSNAAWGFGLTSSGNISLVVWITSVGANTINSTALVPFSARQKGWIRVTYIHNTGAGNYSATFETSADGVSWTQLGAVVTGSNLGTIATSTAPMWIGAQNTGISPFTGAVYSILVKDSSNVPVIDWVADDSTDLQTANQNDRIAGTPTVFTYGNCNMLIKKGLLLPQTVATYMDITNPFTVSDYRSGLRCAGNYSVAGTLFSLASGLTSNFTCYLHQLFSGLWYNSSSDKTYGPSGSIGYLGTSSVVSSIIAGSGRVAVNGVSGAGASAAITPPQFQVDTLFKRAGSGTNTNQAAFRKVGAWISGTLPAEADVKTWLDA